MKVFFGLVTCLLCLAPAVSAAPLYFGGWEDGAVAFSRDQFEAWMPVEQVTVGDDGQERPLIGGVYVSAGKLQSVESTGEFGTGRYDYGRATLTMITDHGRFTAVIPSLAFDLTGGIDDYDDGTSYDWRDIYPAPFPLKNAKYDAELASYLGVHRKPTSADWFFYADGFDRGDREMGETGTLAGRIYQFNPTFLHIESKLRALPSTDGTTAGTASVSEPSILALAGAAAVGLMRRRLRRDR